MEHVLSGRGERRQRASVKAVFKRYDRRASVPVFFIRIETRRFDRAFVRLSTGVGEKDFFHADTAAEHLCQFSARARVIKVRCVLELSELIAHRLLPDGIRNAERIDRNARTEIYIFLARIVGEMGTLSLHERHGKTRIGMRNVFVIE